MKFLITTSRKEHFSDFVDFLNRENHAEISWAETGEEGLERLKNELFDLVVTDERLPDMTGLKFLDGMMHINPMISCAAVSSLSVEDFHEASEGLGILAQLSPHPDRAQAEELINRLAHVQGLQTF